MKKNKFCLRFRLMKLCQMLCIHSYQYCYYSVCCDEYRFHCKWCKHWKSVKSDKMTKRYKNMVNKRFEV